MPEKRTIEYAVIGAMVLLTLFVVGTYIFWWETLEVAQEKIMDENQGYNIEDDVDSDDPEAPFYCQDTDSFDLYSRGEVQFSSDDVDETYIDFCDDDGMHVHEWLCESIALDRNNASMPENKFYDCPFGCENGACVRGTAEQIYQYQGEDAFVMLTTPNGGEEICTGKSFSITWKSRGIIFIDIFVEAEKDGIKHPLPRVATSDEGGTFSWDGRYSFGEKFLPGKYKILLFGIDQTTQKIVKDQSDDYFSIIDCN